MITTTYTCDRCKKAQDTPNQMWRVGFKVASADNRHSSNGRAEDATPSDYSMQLANASLWCRECIDSLQLLGIQAKKPVETAPAPEVTLEEMLREIIRMEIEAAHS